MNEERAILLDVDDGVAEITINRPHVLNALDPGALRLLRDGLTACRDDDRVRVVILTGAGERSFCVGTDLKATSGPGASHDDDYIGLYSLHRLDLWKPLIAAINGHCVGGGLEIALQCDLRVASTRASFALPEARVGSMPGGGGVSLLVRRLPRAVAMEMMLAGTALSADAALAHGLVSALHAPDALLPAARALARQVAACAPLSVQAIKRLAFESDGLATPAAFDLATRYFTALKDTEDRAEGRRAFAEKRVPRFVGR
jgi:E-phenylitaconyl-CoA hydratase